VLDDPDECFPCGQWADFVFLGLDGTTIWNATIQTCSMRFWDMAENEALETAEKLSPQEDTDERHDGFFAARKVVRNGMILYEQIPQEPKTYEYFNNKTWFEFICATEDELCKTRNYPVCEEFEIRRDYAYGVGLVMTVDEAVIDTAAIERAILRFQLNSESDWCSEPIARDRLPREAARTISMRRHPEQ
jgi:hypothetical protein